MSKTRIEPFDSLVIETILPLDYPGHPKHEQPQVHWYAGVTRDPHDPKITGPLWSPYWEDAEGFGTSLVNENGHVKRITAEQKAQFIIDECIQMGGVKAVPIKDARIDESVVPLKKKKWWKFN